MNLENEILQLCFDVLEKEITPLEAQKEILRLLNVVGQSEQLKTEDKDLPFADYLEKWYEQPRYADYYLFFISAYDIMLYKLFIGRVRENRYYLEGIRIR